MSGLGDWLAMGGYAAFIWPCYILAALLIVGLALQAWLRLAAAQRTLSNQARHGGDAGSPP